MSVSKEQSGVYRQVAHRLRIHGADGASRDSERPRAGRRGDWKHYLDSAEAPTLIELFEGDQANVEALLAGGAIQHYSPPKAVKKPRKEAPTDGETGSA